MLHICNNVFKPFEISYYVGQNGKAPFREWLENLRDSVVRARVEVRINRLRRGLFGDTRNIGGGVEELKLHFGPGYRIYYGRVENRIIVLLCGGSKESQRRDVESARRYWSDYMEALYGKEKTVR